MKDIVLKNKKKFILVLLMIIITIICVYTGTIVYSITILSDYENKVYPNVYVDEFDISNLDNEKLPSKINDINEKVKNSEIIFVANEKEYKYVLSDLGISINTDKIVKKILDYDKNLTFVDKINKIVKNEKSLLNYELTYSTEKLTAFFETLKKKVDVNSKQGKLVMNSNRELTYQKGTNSFSLDVSENVKLIETHLYNLLENNRLELIGKISEPDYDVLSTINTKVSSFSTKFNDKISRGTNVKNAAKYLDGIILQPGQVFSFFKYAGPYSPQRYVYYGGIVANGICQVASTLYNTQLLAGLQTVRRYGHGTQVDYVKGGLDATVAQLSSGAITDYKFKNTYKYPVYISAYTKKGEVIIEFWSNDKAKEGKEYKLESKQIAYKGYKTYLLVYENNKLVDRKFLATTWYKN